MRASLLGNGAWSPRNLGGELMLWFDAADYSTMFLGTGSSVKAWIDRGPIGLAAAGSTLPAYRQSAINGRPAINFSTGSQGLATPAIFIPQEWSAFAVLGVGTAPASFQKTVCARGASSPLYADFIAITSGPKTGVQAYNTAGAIFGAPGVSFSAGNVIISGVRKATQVLDAVNGGAYAATTTSGTPASSTYQVSLGNQYPFSSAYNFIGNMGEVIICNRAYDGSAGTSPLHLIIPGYLAWKWGLQSLLPAMHPFKHNPP
jgi:hypothetical protein